MKEKKSLAQQTKEYLELQPYIKYSLKNGLINYSALSKKICKEFNIKETENKLASISIAIRRYKIQLDKSNTQNSKISNILKKSTLEINTGINIYITKQKIENLPKGRHHTINSNDFNILITKEQLDIKTYKKHINTVEILIKSPEKIEDESGLILEILQKLFEFNINIIEMYSCYINTIIIINKKDLIKIINALNQLKIN